jgi:nitrate reductase NapD
MRDFGHVSSAVITVMPAAANAVRARIAALAGIEIHAAAETRIVITIEGPGSGFVGETLARIALFDGVISACMVFEHVEPLEEQAS